MYPTIFHKKVSAMNQEIAFASRILGLKNKIYFFYKPERVICNTIFDTNLKEAFQYQFLIFDNKHFFRWQKKQKNKNLYFQKAPNRNVSFCFFQMGSIVIADTFFSLVL